MKNFIILLPNSKSKNLENNFDTYKRIMQNKEDNFFNFLDKNREFIYENLLKIIDKNSKENLSKIFDLKNLQKLDFEINEIKNLYDNKTNNSIEKFSGVMFKSINYNSIKKEIKENFDKNIIFIDALFGALKPLDKIPNYKLEFTTKFNFNLKNYWTEKLENIFNKIIENDIIIIDLLPQTHKVFNKKVLDYENYFEVIFCEIKNNTLKNCAHNSKKLKGDLIKYLCGKEKINIDFIKKFKHKNGFVFDKENSNSNKIIFTKF